MRSATPWVYRLVNEPWVHVPRWLRARRVSKIASKRMEAAHVEWARKLREKSVI